MLMLTINLPRISGNGQKLPLTRHFQGIWGLFVPNRQGAMPLRAHRLDECLGFEFRQTHVFSVFSASFGATRGITAPEVSGSYKARKTTGSIGPSSDVRISTLTRSDQPRDFTELFDRLLVIWVPSALTSNRRRASWRGG